MLTISPRALRRIRLVEPTTPPRPLTGIPAIGHTAQPKDPVIFHQGKWIKKYVASPLFPKVRYPVVLP
jgi:hypothetical protein